MLRCIEHGDHYSISAISIKRQARINKRNMPANGGIAWSWQIERGRWPGRKSRASITVEGGSGGHQPVRHGRDERKPCLDQLFKLTLQIRKRHRHRVPYRLIVMACVEEDRNIGLLQVQAEDERAPSYRWHTGYLLPATMRPIQF